MRRLTKILAALFLVLALVVGVLPQSVGAAPKAHGVSAAAKVKGPKIKFKDIEKSWARDYIVEMAAAGILKGITEDRFAPEEPVEGAQVLAMLVRALGLEEEALSLDGSLLNQDYLASLPGWARPYAQLAVENGIVTREELAAWQPGQKATRLEVARYLTRLLGKEEEVERQDEALLSSLRFKDLAGLPAPLRVYILIVSNAGLMTGDTNGNWMPHGLINRGQMAKILSLILSRLAPVPGALRTVVTGEIVDIDEGDDSEAAEITVKTVQGEATYVLAEDVEITVDGKGADLEDLAVGQRVHLILARTADGNAEVVYIRAENLGPEKVEVKGTIKSLTLGLDASITVRTGDGRETTLVVREDTVIAMGGREVLLSDLELGQKVEVKGFREGDKLVATEINAEAEETEISGRVVAVVIGDRPALTMEDDREVRYTFRISARTRIRLHGERAVLADLKPGDEVTVRAAGGEALSVEAERPEEEEREVSGRIVTLVFGDNPSLSVKTGSGKVYTYRITGDTRIRLDGKAATLDELRTGWEVELTVKGDVALTVEAESPQPKEEEVTGELVQLQIGSKNLLVIQDQDGRRREFQVAKGVRVLLDGKEGTLWQLNAGMELTLKVRSGVIYEIEVVK